MIALDLFAGTGWGVALQRLGIEEYGVELMPEAVATRDAAGMTTIFRDVWEGLFQPQLVTERIRAAREGTLLPVGDDAEPVYDMLIASPPCQTFSMAGSGAGRRAMSDIQAAIDRGDYLDPAALHSLTETMDPRTALVLVPLAYIARDRPRVVVLEQVVTVMPVWSAYASALGELGYSVDVGILNCEQYGVPQTRRRAILVARRDDESASLPVPTHSRYYSREPQRLDAGMLPWVSMADALGGGGFDLVGNQVPRGAQRGDYHSRSSDYPAQTITSGSRVWALRSNYSTGSGGVAPEGSKLPRTERGADEPSSTITSKAGSMTWFRRGLENRPSPTITGGGTETGGAEPIAKWARYAGAEGWVGDKRRLSLAEAAVLQSYPADFPFQGVNGKRFLQVGNAVPPLLAQSIIERLVGAELAETRRAA